MERPHSVGTPSLFPPCCLVLWQSHVTLTWLKNTDDGGRCHLSTLPSQEQASRGHRDLRVVWGTVPVFHASTIPSITKVLTGPHQTGRLWQSQSLRLPQAPSACSLLQQKSFGFSKAWEEGGAENSAGKRTWVEISVAILLRQRLWPKPKAWKDTYGLETIETTKGHPSLLF